MGIPWGAPVEEAPEETSIENAQHKEWLGGDEAPFRALSISEIRCSSSAAFVTRAEAEVGAVIAAIWTVVASEARRISEIVDVIVLTVIADDDAVRGDVAVGCGLRGVGH